MGTRSGTTNRYVIEESASKKHGYERGYAGGSPLLPLIESLIEYVINLVGGLMKGNLASSVVGVTSHVLVVPLPDVYLPTLS
ncbi:hypothetical protein Nepgr_024819 [Nepenthes gracilis]|uniref:Uncharacterized protein n=1 Tax=Nepenthes gracilis TaxID=150966 RepID=A0AAD3T5H1_NEPGR|nr:hypothetical protein Nepgr_024819 [Nepenthes gracilis]